ncbi:MAG: FdhF/YdeP family oxidoreductase, partial [Deltaproteobacteria bacterium]|nr:FdhF/YdeP family oxidoreductase [Deltaproteobacteria bacterium]
MKRSRIKIKPYTAPAGGWGSAKSVTDILRKEGVLLSGVRLLPHQNKPNGYACPSCAWAKPAKHNPLEFCENGAKATAWEITSHRADPAFFASHTVAELLNWPDHELEQQGRLTHPMRWDGASDKYLPIEWDVAFAEIAAELRKCDPKAAVFYASGRASLEAAYIYALMTRLYGSNNLPDCSNMCHESTSVALPESIGVSVGTVTLDDFAATDCIYFFGQNVGSNSPRMLHSLQTARQRNVPIVTFNPLHERGLERFVNPQSPREMLTSASTPISTQYHQVKAGGDLAAIAGICKKLFEMDDVRNSVNERPVIDHQFIAQHVHGYEQFRAAINTYSWEQLERHSGLSRIAMEAAASVYAQSDRVIAIYGMGLTQHRAGVETVQMLVNLLLLRGNIGKRGAGICPVRGHSNVQGQRTVGISEKPELVPLDRLAQQYGFSPPRDKGLNTIETCEAVVAGRIDAFIGLGGNFVRAVPDR